MANRLVVVYDPTFREVGHLYYEYSGWKAERDILLKLSSQYEQSTMIDVYEVDETDHTSYIRSECAESLRASSTN